MIICLSKIIPPYPPPHTHTRNDTYYVCRFQKEIIGFIEIVKSAEDSAVIRLAAVDPKYRLSGGALSLYAGIANLFKENGFRRIEGRISCKNMPVLNLYASLGANFSSPLDIYIRS